MVEDLTCLFPSDLYGILRFVGKLRNWLVIRSSTDPIDGLPTTVYKVDFAKLNAASDCSEKGAIINWARDGYQNSVYGKNNMLGLGLLEMGGYMIANGPKLFRPTAEQFESFEHVDLHIPIADFRAPYPAFVVRIPNEWRARKTQELGIDRPQPLHVAVRTTTTTEGKVSILCVLKYEHVEHYNVVTDHPNHLDLQAAVEFIVDMARNYDQRRTRLEVKEYEYCVAAIHAALNCCLMLVHYGHREGNYLDPRRHAVRNKNNDQRRHGDFKSVDMVQNIIIRQSAAIGELPVGVSSPSEGEPTGREVRPHWRRGHWRRKPGWQAYVERNEKPPLSFVRPCLVRKDRIVGDVGDSQTTYVKR